MRPTEKRQNLQLFESTLEAAFQFKSALTDSHGKKKSVYSIVAQTQLELKFMGVPPLIDKLLTHSCRSMGH